MRDAVDSIVTVVIGLCAVAATASLLMREPASASPSGVRDDTPVSETQWGALLQGRHKLGRADAPVQIVVMADFECPSCGAFARTVLPAVLEEYADAIAVTYRHWPLDYHPRAMPLALASECAAEQGHFWAFHDAVFSEGTSIADVQLEALAQMAALPDQDAFLSCAGDERYRSVVEEDAGMAATIGAWGTPTIVVNGTMLGSSGLRQPFIDAIEDALAER